MKRARRTAAVTIPRGFEFWSPVLAQAWLRDNAPPDKNNVIRLRLRLVQPRRRARGKA